MALLNESIEALRMAFSFGAKVQRLSFHHDGGDSAASDWAKASSENTVSAYQNITAAHPEDQHASDAQAYVVPLQDDQGWQEAQ